MYKTTESGVLVGVYMLEIYQEKKFVVLIDYFTRLIFTKYLRSKDVDKIVNFIDTTYKELKFKKLLCDGGGEFNNKLLKCWAAERGLKIIFSVPYYHHSNGRVERVNRTLREALKKTNGPLKKLKIVTDNYNNSYHRGIDTTPRLALKRENLQRILDHAEKYEKEFHNNKKIIKQKRFEKGEDVILRNETRKSKMEPRYKEKGKIVKEVYKNVYEVFTEKEKIKMRHSTQLKKLGPGMLETVSPKKELNNVEMAIERRK
jgi:hypothetical protein